MNQSSEAAPPSSHASVTDGVTEPGAFEVPDRRRRRKVWRKILGVLLVLVLLSVAAVAAYVWYLGRLWTDNSNQLSDEEIFSGEAPVAEKGDALNVLLLGSDARSTDVDYSEDARGNRADTIMIMHINGDRSGVQVMTIPRDTWVDIEGHGKAKINAAMSYGGLSLATDTVSDFIGAPIHHVAIIDFDGFQALTDSVGGVDVESEQAFESDGHSFSQGANHLGGDEALAFVRARKNFADGDLQRGRNQQAFLRGLADKIVTADTLGNPGKVAGIVRDFSPYMTVDDRLTSSKIAGLAYEIRDVRPGDVQFFSSPIGSAGRSADGQSILTVDEEGLEEVRDAFSEDTVDDYAETAGDVHL